MKKVKSIILVLLLVTMNILLFTGCSCNRMLLDLNFKLKYAIVVQNNVRVLHKIDQWHDSDSESATIRTTCCNNYIWFSANNGELYENLPKESWYDVICENC